MESQGTSALQQGHKYTLEDWRNWPADEQWELISGVPFSMSPAPKLKHQRLLGRLSAQLFQQLEGESCEPFISPVDLYPFPDGGRDEKNTVVQPDLMIVCDEQNCREDGISGSPDWVMEILSSSTAYKDQTEKKNLYQKCGVREYWILNPETLDLLIYKSEANLFGPPVGVRFDKPVAISALPGISLKH